MIVLESLNQAGELAQWGSDLCFYNDGATLIQASRNTPLQFRRNGQPFIRRRYAVCPRRCALKFWAYTAAINNIPRLYNRNLDGGTPWPFPS